MSSDGFYWDADEENVKQRDDVSMAGDDDDDDFSIDSNDSYVAKLTRTLHLDGVEEHQDDAFNFDLEFMLGQDVEIENQYGDSGSVKTFNNEANQETRIEREARLAAANLQLADASPLKTLFPPPPPPRCRSKKPLPVQPPAPSRTPGPYLSNNSWIKPRKTQHCSKPLWTQIPISSPPPQPSPREAQSNATGLMGVFNGPEPALPDRSMGYFWAAVGLGKNATT